MRRTRIISATPSLWTWWVIAVVAVGFWAAPRATAQERSDQERNLVEILEGLEHGLVALERLGLHNEYERLQRVANDVRGELRYHRGRSETGPRPGGQPGQRGRGRSREGDAGRRQAANGVEVMRMALPALKEAGRRDSAELLQRAIRAREVQLEGRRDPEAIRIRKQAPTLGQQIELLAHAAKLWQDFGHERKAEVIARLAERKRSSLRRGDGRRRGGEPRREALLPRIERLELRVAELQRGLEEVKGRLRAAGQRRQRGGGPARPR